MNLTVVVINLKDSTEKITLKSYIKGVDDNEVIDEVTTSTNVIYPLEEGKIYINVNQVLDHIRENANKYKALNCIKSNQYLKSTISEVYRVHFNWKRYTRKESTKSVYIRTESMENN